MLRSSDSDTSGRHQQWPLKKVLMTGAAGYIANQLLPTFRETYDIVLVDATDTDRQGNQVESIPRVVQLGRVQPLVS